MMFFATAFLSVALAANDPPRTADDPGKLAQMQNIAHGPLPPEEKGRRLVPLLRSGMTRAEVTAALGRSVDEWVIPDGQAHTELVSVRFPECNVTVQFRVKVAEQESSRRAKAESWQSH